MAAAGGSGCAREGCDDGVLGVDGCCTSCGRPPHTTASDPAERPDVPPPSTTVDSRDTGAVRRISAPDGASGRIGVPSGPAGRRRMLGAGMVDMPTVPERDPLDAVLTDPEVPERRRRCGRCDHEVGRTRGPRPARTEGFCAYCGSRYSFIPKLRAGDLVGGQYLVAGCLAHGGLGWIYLAEDQNLDGAWVVLKGLLDSGDEAATAAALAEKRFLTQVRHPNIVRIYNFVQHNDDGYIVMEYIGGLSLRDLRLRHREETGEPLGVQQAIGYVLGILPALEYLHDRDLLFCDFKPDNVLHTTDHVTLIDLGGVRRTDDDVSDLYGTVGYQAPEASPDRVSIASDLYTVGRTLASLTLDLAGFQDEKRYARKLPPLQEVKVFQRYEPFHRFLQRATSAKPSRRFQSAAEMGEQLHGVLRQVVALDGGTPVPALSTQFSAELGASAESIRWQFLPVPAVDPADPSAGVLATAALLGADQRRVLVRSTPRTPESSLALARFAIDDGDFEAASRELGSEEARSSGWRAAWWQGALHLAQDRAAEARPYFAAVARELPGELAPKLALAACFEHMALGRDHWPASLSQPPRGVSADETREAVRYYSLVAATDPTYPGACFGLARAYAVLGDREKAVAALERVPQSSSAHRSAQVALCTILCARLQKQEPGLQDLVASSKTLDGLDVDNSVRLPLLRDLHDRALSMLLDETVAADERELLGGAELTEFGQRNALERTYRSLARLAPTEEQRCALVDQANASRPRTLV
ncbi:MAG TPA: tetratricopeptide repeat protein [Acidimicrobiales bacterium]|nr:tetratricopeptide repeat protein [Acidimicrobiales bacterium]